MSQHFPLTGRSSAAKFKGLCAMSISNTAARQLVAVSLASFLFLVLSSGTRAQNGVWGWGSNVVGELGDGTVGYTNVPVQAKAISGVIALAEGSDCTLALKADG